MKRSLPSLWIGVALAALSMGGEAQAQETPATVAIGHIVTPTLSPADWLPRFVADGRRETVLTTGHLEHNQAIVTYPFDYRFPLRLKADIHTFLHKLPAGSPGFDVGDFSTRVGLEHVMCFFRMDQAQPYAVPECLRYLNLLGVKWATAMVSNNLPTQMENGDPIIGTPEVETVGVIIPHDFSFQLMFDSWSQRAVHFHWTSDGRTVWHFDLPLKADGTAAIDTDNGTNLLTRDAADPSSIVVAYVPKPRVSPTPPSVQANPGPDSASSPGSPSGSGGVGAKAVVVDGIVYTPKP